MLNAVELGILDACANHYELFYFLFAEVNYDGEVVRMSPEKPDRRFYPQVEDEGTWSVSVPGEEVARHVRWLIWSGLLQCWRVSDDPGDHGPFLTPEKQTSGLNRRRVEITEPEEQEFAAYRGYDCPTFNEHMQRFGYGPHEFRITQSGMDEMQRPEYDEFYET